MNKPVILLSVFLSAIVLTLVGGVVYTAKSAGAAPAAEVDSELVQTLQERELVYQDMLSEANARIETANVLLGKPQDPAAAPNDGVPQQAVFMQITPEEAAALASEFISETGVYSVENADYEGLAAYEVLFNSGSVVYVDLSGQVIAYELAPIYTAQQGSPEISFEQSSSSQNSHNDDNGHENEDHEDHEDHDDHGEYEDD